MIQAVERDSPVVVSGAPFRQHREPPRTPPVSQARWSALALCERHLLASPTPARMDAYLTAIRGLLADALQSQKAEVGPYFSPKGRFRQMIFIRQLNDELDELVRDLRDGRLGTGIAERVDAIRGLLLDILL